jgi:hypothetical protein
MDSQTERGAAARRVPAGHPTARPSRGGSTAAPHPAGRARAPPRDMALPRRSLWRSRPGRHAVRSSRARPPRAGAAVDDPRGRWNARNMARRGQPRLVVRVGRRKRRFARDDVGDWSRPGSPRGAAAAASAGRRTRARDAGELLGAGKSGGARRVRRGARPRPEPGRRAISRAGAGRSAEGSAPGSRRPARKAADVCARGAHDGPRARAHVVRQDGFAQASAHGHHPAGRGRRRARARRCGSGRSSPPCRHRRGRPPGQWSR